MNVSQLMIKCLEAEGVKYIFGVPGEENEDFLFALEDSSIKFIPTRHEQGGAFIADVWGRLTGKAGVCLSTLGPGATNLMTGVADAHLDKAPLVALTGQGGIDRIHHESHQIIDVVGMMKPITKWNAKIINGEVVHEMVRKAFKLAQAEKPGATHLELPEDVAGASVKEGIKPIKPSKVYRPIPENSTINKAVEILKNAKTPIILAGNGSIRTRASKALTSLSTSLNIPVATTFMAKGAISDKLPNSLRAIGLGFKDYVLEAFEKADVVFCIGYDVAEYSPAKWNETKDKKIIHLDFEPAEVYEEYKARVEIVGDIANGIEAVHKNLEGTKYSNWYEDVRDRIVASIESYKSQDNSDHLNAPNVIAATREVIPDNALLISDVGSHKMWIGRNYPTYIPNGCIISNGFASMGIALPGLIAGYLVDQGRPVISIMGDGGSLMNIQEIETAVRLGVKGVMIILNDNNYGLIKWKQQMNEGKSFGTNLGNPNFVELAHSFGMEAYKPETIGELKEKIKEAIEQNKLVLLEVAVHTEVNDELTESLKNYFNK